MSVPTDPNVADLEELKPTFDPETQNIRVLELSSGFAVIQQGGSSEELYLHISNTEDDAEAFRRSCEDAAYATSIVIEVPHSVMALHPDTRGEVYAFIDTLLKSAARLLSE
jgi:hypothetical protein